MISKRDREEARVRRHTRLRKKLAGTAARPRLSVFVSLRHVYAQLIDDESGRTLAAATNLKHVAEGGSAVAKDSAACQLIGKEIAEKALGMGIRTVAFDRGGHSYHGRIKALADAARAAGLEF